MGFNAFEHNPAEYAKEINLPTLLLYGAKDARVTRAEIDEIYKNLRSEKVMGIMQNSGHEIYLNDDHESWNRFVDAFMEME